MALCDAQYDKWGCAEWDTIKGVADRKSCKEAGRIMDWVSAPSRSDAYVVSAGDDGDETSYQPGEYLSIFVRTLKVGLVGGSGGGLAFGHEHVHYSLQSYHVHTHTIHIPFHTSLPVPDTTHSGVSQYHTTHTQTHMCSSSSSFPPHVHPRVSSPSPNTGPRLQIPWPRTPCRQCLGFDGGRVGG